MAAVQKVDLLVCASPTFKGHKATFVVWLAVPALHVVGRFVPALRLTLPSTAPAVPGRFWRAATILLTVAVAVAATVLVLQMTGPWQFQPDREHAEHAVHR